jgi:capsular exopolysaccharide synthesis family protein
LYSPELPFATEFRRLLHKVRNSDTQAELKTFLFTSAMLCEGKSTVCSFLALTAARQKGLKTLVVDCDLRRPAIHKFFAMDREPGLSEILVEGFGPKDAIKKTAVDKLDVITSGRETRYPTEVFDTEAIGQLLDEMKFYYDLILVDSPPLLPVSDPMLLAAKIDSIILVVKAGATQSEIVRRGVEILGNYRSKILGVVLNNMNNTLPYYYDYRYYGYSYGEPSPKNNKNKKNSPSKKKERSRNNRTRSAGKNAVNDHIVRPA